MALTTEEQRFYDFARAALPGWIPDPDEFLMGAAKMFGSVHALISYLFGNALIGTAVGSSATTPDWLEQHAIDRGTRRQLDESDEVLRERLQTVPDALTRTALLAAIGAALAAEGVTGDAALVELPAHGAHGGTYAIDAGTGGTFTDLGGGLFSFAPTAGWARPPYFAPVLVPAISTRLEINNATDPANDGAFAVSGVVGNAAIFTNAGAAGADPAAEWDLVRLDQDGNVRDGFARAFSQRGYRSARLRPGVLVVILPFDATAATVAGVREALRQRKAAGIAVRVERRLIP